MGRQSAAGSAARPLLRDLEPGTFKKGAGQAGPLSELLGERGAGFAIAQDRLGPGRIHHCMRAIGSAERAHEMMCRRANERVAFGGPLGEKQFVQEAIASSRMEIDQARLLTLYAAWKMDTEGKRAARQAISAIKIVAANMVMDVLDRAIQIHGSLGMTDDTPSPPSGASAACCASPTVPTRSTRWSSPAASSTAGPSATRPPRPASWSRGTRPGWSEKREADPGAGLHDSLLRVASKECC